MTWLEIGSLILTAINTIWTILQQAQLQAHASTLQQIQPTNETA